MLAILRWTVACAAVMLWVTTASINAEAARIGLNVGGGAGAPGIHIEHATTSRTALSLTGGLNRLYSGYYIQAGRSISGESAAWAPTLTSPAPLAPETQATL